MQKLIYTCILILLGLELIAQDNVNDVSKYKIYYNLTYQKDSTDISSKSTELFSLLIGEHSSLFQSEQAKYNDSLIQALSSSKTISDPQMMVNAALAQKKGSRFGFKILKTTEASINVIDKIFTDSFLYKETINLDWKITSKSKQIASYNCKKATTNFAGRQYIAWFTTDIPISEGPYNTVS